MILMRRVGGVPESSRRYEVIATATDALCGIIKFLDAIRQID